MTLWFPDTCDCQIEISDEDGHRGEAIKHLKVCSIHAARNDDHHKVLVENQRKNLALADVKAAMPDSAPTWAFDNDRRVVIGFSNMPVRASGRAGWTQPKIPTQTELDNLKSSLAGKYGDAVTVTTP